MNKKILYSVSVLIIVLVAVAGWFLYTSRTTNETKSPDFLIAADAVEKAQSGVSDAVEKTNPFAADVNPTQGYKNPFE